jgi:hypothetical protein
VKLWTLVESQNRAKTRVGSHSRTFADVSGPRTGIPDAEEVGGSSPPAPTTRKARPTAIPRTKEPKRPHQPRNSGGGSPETRMGGRVEVTHFWDDLDYAVIRLPRDGLPPGVEPLSLTLPPQNVSLPSL